MKVYIIVKQYCTFILFVTGSMRRRQAIVGQEFLIPLSYDGQVRPLNKRFRKQEYSSVREVRRRYYGHLKTCCVVQQLRYSFVFSQWTCFPIRYYITCNLNLLFSRFFLVARPATQKHYFIRDNNVTEKRRE